MIKIDKLIKIQNKLAKKIVLKPFKLPEKYYLAAFDISFIGNEGYGVCVIVNEKMSIVERLTTKKTVSFPYIPTFLAFREIPILVELYKKIKFKPELILVDGNGTIHPRRCGIAVHFGIITKKPTIGVAKSHLYGKYKEPQNKRFSYSQVYDEDNNAIGVAIRTKENSKPIFVSPGNMIDINSAVDVLKKLTLQYRIPQPLRLAHIEANRYRKSKLNH